MSLSSLEALPEKRLAPRVKRLFRGQIRLDDRMSTFDCVIRNMSDEGARIDVVGGHLPSTSFDLLVPIKRCSYRAHVVWRGEGTFGVRLAELEKAPGIEQSQARLREDNERLRRIVGNLERRVQQLTGGDCGFGTSSH